MANTTRSMFILFFFFLIGASMAARRNPVPRASHSREDLVEMAGYGEDKISTILVTGSVLCETPDYIHGDGQSYRSQPVPGALVAVNCHSSRKMRRSSSGWVEGVTDEYGDFTIDLPSHLHAIPDLHKKCSVKLLKIPKNLSHRCRRPGSKHATQHRKGMNLSAVEDGARTYAAGTIRLQHRSSK